MKNKGCKFLFIFILTTLILQLSNCSPKYYIVTFNPNYDSANISTYNVKEKTTVSAPNTPSRSGYTFNGWRVSNDDSSELFNFSTPITKDTTLYGSWEMNSFPFKLTPKIYVIDEYGNVSDSGDKLETYFFSNNDVSYLSIKNGVSFYMNVYSAYYPSYFTNYSYSNTDNVSIITNTKNYAKCTINFLNQTMTFTDYDAFINMDSNQKTPLDTGFFGSRGYFAESILSYDKPSNPLTIDFKHYNIPIYYYNDQGYLPIHVYNNILCQFCTQNLMYANEKFFYNKVDDDYQLTAYSNLRNKYGVTSFKKKYLEYCYNLAALTLDTRFGLINRSSRSSKGTIITYPNDAYTILSNYKEQLLSTSNNTANKVFSDFLNSNYDDGGHTAMNSYAFNDTTNYSFTYGQELQYTSTILSTLSSSRKSKGLNPSSKVGNSKAIGYYEELNYKNNDTAFLTFDYFLDNETPPTYDKVDSSNYYKSLIGLVRYTDKMLRTNTNITKLVIDLSCNTGGAVYDEFFIASYLCGGASSINANLKTGALSKVSFKADMNGDGEFNDSDKLPSSVSLYVLISPSSFSCGNLLPTTLMDYGSNVRFIGSNSGGGACYVLSGLQTGLGSTYQVSSNNASCLKDSTSSNIITNDNGVSSIAYPIDIPTTISIANEYYDRETIYNKIHS